MTKTCPYCRRLLDVGAVACMCGWPNKPPPPLGTQLRRQWAGIPKWGRVMTILGLIFLLAMGNGAMQRQRRKAYSDMPFSATHWACQRCAGSGRVFVYAVGRGMGEADCPRCGGSGVDPESPDSGPHWHYLVPGY